MTNKLTKTILSIWLIWFIWSSLCLWQLIWWWKDLDYIGSDFPYSHESVKQECDSTNLWDCVDIKDNDSIINRLLVVFWLDTDTFWWDHKFINYAKAILNMALWLISMIAFVMIIYTFYMMFFSDNDAWIKKAKWNLVWIFIALAVIWLAWIIVSFIFWRYRTERKNNQVKLISYSNTHKEKMISTVENETEVKNQIYFTI